MEHENYYNLMRVFGNMVSGLFKMGLVIFCIALIIEFKIFAFIIIAFGVWVYLYMKKSMVKVSYPEGDSAMDFFKPKVKESSNGNIIREYNGDKIYRFIDPEGNEFFISDSELRGDRKRE